MSWQAVEAFVSDLLDLLVVSQTLRENYTISGKRLQLMRDAFWNSGTPAFPHYMHFSPSIRFTLLLHAFNTASPLKSQNFKYCVLT